MKLTHVNKLLAGINLGLMAGMVAMGFYLYFRVLPGKGEKVIYESRRENIPFTLVEKKPPPENKTLEKTLPASETSEEPPPPIPITPEGTKVERELLTIHLGDFLLKDEAERAISIAKSMGLDTFISKDIKKTVFTRVLAGPFKRRELPRVKRVIRRVFPKINVMRKGRSYYVHIGSFSKDVEVEKAVKKLEGMGFNVKKEKVEVKKIIYSIDAGRFTRFDDAKKYVEEFKKKGFDTFLIPIKSR